jgi:hypothetical protein
MLLPYSNSITRTGVVHDHELIWHDATLQLVFTRFGIATETAPRKEIVIEFR